MDTRTGAGRLGAVGACAVLVGLAVFPYRLEYTAHLAAGLGLAGVGWAVVHRFGTGGRRSNAGSDVAATLSIVLVVGVISEVVVTGPFELLDFANTLMGGLLGVAAVAPVGEVEVDGVARRRTAVVGLAFVALGLLVRYPIQGALKTTWWYGS